MKTIHILTFQEAYDTVGITVTELICVHTKQFAQLAGL